MSDKKTFNIGDKHWSGHNLGTFIGRLKYYREVCSPEKSFKSTATITQYLQDVKALKASANEKGEAQLTAVEYETYR